MENSESIEIVEITPENIGDYGVCGYKNVKKNLELRRKIEWMKEYYPKGLRIKALISETGGYQGMIEYIPGEYAFRPVEVTGYMFIHCLYVGFKKEFKGKGYASLLINKCIEEAKKNNMKGVTVVTRKGSFMAKKDIFIKNKFELIDKKKPDFELLVHKFEKNDDKLNFKDSSLEEYSNGLFILRSSQCPYSVKNVDAIINTAKDLGYKLNLIELDKHTLAQNSPCGFGTFSIILDGKILSHHPISNSRFENIMKKV